MTTTHSETWRHRLFAAGFSAIATTRADLWLRNLAMGRGVILTFHHVRPWREKPFSPNRALEITPEFLETTVAFLRHEGVKIISIDEVPDRLRSSAAGRPFAVLTFDDGYRDNIEHAWPVLKRLRAPWTVYVVKDYADGVGSLWWLELERAIEELDTIEIVIGSDEFFLPAQTTMQKNSAFHVLHRRLKRCTQEQLRKSVADLSARVGFAPNRLVEDLCATWDEIAMLVQDPHVTVGSHTLSHAILARHDDDCATNEIAESKAAIEEKLGRPIRHFAYPHGDPGSAGLREFELSRRSGYATAVTTRPGHLFPRHARQLTALPRISINGLHQNRFALRALLSGVPFMPFEFVSRERMER